MDMKLSVDAFGTVVQMGLGTCHFAAPNVTAHPLRDNAVQCIHDLEGRSFHVCAFFCVLGLLRKARQPITMPMLSSPVVFKGPSR